MPTITTKKSSRKPTQATKTTKRPPTPKAAPTPLHVVQPTEKPANPIAARLADMAARPMRTPTRSADEQRAELVALRHSDGIAWNRAHAASLGALAAAAVGATSTKRIAEEALDAVALSLHVLDNAIGDPERGILNHEIICLFLQQLARQTEAASELAARFAHADEYRKTADLGIVPPVDGRKAVAS